MMGDAKLCLLMLLSTSALAFAQDDDQPTCLLRKTYKPLHKYEYQYEAESLNAINGASMLKNGPKASCTVGVEVPQSCSFIIRTTGCSLSEVVDTDDEGNAVFAPAPSSADFASEMEKYPIKVVAEGAYDVKLYPEDGETTTILNIKRGIISALAVPLLERGKQNLPTIHGKCQTHYKVNVGGAIATDISLNRDLSTCDRFSPMRDYTSPLALISGMHNPLAQLVKSHQACNYRFDTKKKHVISGSCTESHILIPFSHKGQYGLTTVGKQELRLVQVSPHNDRVFHHSGIHKGLHMEAVEDKSAVQDKNPALNLLRELATLPESEGERRAHLFHRLVSMVRGMKTGTLAPAIPEALAISRVLTYQVLAQCGTPECSSAIMQILRTFDSSSLEVDTTVVAMGLISNPSALLIHDMLQMAQYKPSKPIMYALSNVVKRFYKVEGKVIPEISSVAEFMAARLGDCSGDNNDIFLTLRVIGNMGQAVLPANPALREAVIGCVNQPSASLDVQQAAIQVYRLTPVSQEDRQVLMQVLLDSASPLQKRIAAYLVLMRDPQQSEVIQLTQALPREQDMQFKTFIISHIQNILTSTEPETEELRQKIRTSLHGNDIVPIMASSKISQNFKFGSLEGNVIFDDTSYLPKEVMLEMTLKSFGFDIDMMEIGLAGKGFEPSVDALFGEDGFFPDTALRTMYCVSEIAPPKVNEILENALPLLKDDRMKKQTTHNLIRAIKNNLHKLMRDLRSSEAPEAMAYLRLLGYEMGYVTTSDLEAMANSMTMMIESLLGMFPSYDLIVAMMAKGDHTIFAHYIFMDNEFFLPTLTGVPLRIALSGTFTPGLKGGLKLARDTSEVSFMASAGVEFVTQVGSHIPEYVNSGLEMHTNIFHESGLNAKITVARDQVRLTVPAPVGPTKLIKMKNTLVAVTGSEVKTIPPAMMDRVEVNECTPVFSGMKYCTSRAYFDASSQENTPYFPITGDSKFDVELYPTGEITEYTATVAYELLKEGEEGRQNVDSLKFILRAEGAEPSEARANLKYNRKKNVITADIQIPDYDVEAGLRLGIGNGNTKGKRTHSVYLDFLNKDLPQLSLIGRANLKAMKEGMLQVQVLVPSLKADASVTAKLKHAEEIELELESKIKLADTVSKQKIEIKYDERKIKVELKSDAKTDVLETYGTELLDAQVWNTDVRVRHILQKLGEAANNYMEKYSEDIPYIEYFRLPDMPEISVPEMLFLNTQVKAVYYFSNEYFPIAIPVPYGGKSSEELYFPQTLTTPSLSLPKLGLEFVSMEIPMPEFIVPNSLSFSIPLFGKAELLTVLRSNLYNMDASVAVGKDVLKTPSYSFKFDINGISPIEILSVRLKGSGILSVSESIAAKLESSFAHKFIGASVKIVEDVTISNQLNLKSSSKVEVNSPFGFNFALEHIGTTGINSQEISAENNLIALVEVGRIYAKTQSTQSFALFPQRLEGKLNSTVEFDSTVFKAHNSIAASLANGEFAFVSGTNVLEDIFKHVIELSFKDHKLSVTCDAIAHLLDMTIRNQAQASAESRGIIMRIETSADHFENLVLSVWTASLDFNGLAVNGEATANLLENKATKTFILTMNKDGLNIRGITTLQSPLSLENTFTAKVDSSKATLFIANTAAIHDITAANANTLTVTLSSLKYESQANATVSEYASYSHDIIMDLKPFSSSANVDCNLKLLDANFVNKAKLKAELNKVDLTGSMKGVYRQEEIKHDYQLSYADMTANAKYTTTSKVLGTLMNHNSEVEIVGMAASIKNDVSFNSQWLRIGHKMLCSIVPFDVSLDGIFNADGDVTMYGKHSGQLYGKVLLRAQPLAFAGSHECRGSLTQVLDDGFSHETTFHNKMETVLSLQEQKTRYTLRSKMNQHAFNQDLNVYNTAEGTGSEISGTILTNIFNTDSTENQEFTISGYLKYDKNANTHVIQLPQFEHLPFYLEIVKDCVVHFAGPLNSYFINKDIIYILEEFPEFMSQVISDIDLEGNSIQLKEHFLRFTNQSISVEDVEASLRNMMETSGRVLDGVAIIIIFGGYGIVEHIRHYEPLNFVIEELNQLLDALDKEYEVSDIFEYVLFNLIFPCINALFSMIPEPPGDPMDLIRDSGILDSITRLFANIRELITKFGTDRKIEAVLEKTVELFKQLKITETLKSILQMVKDEQIPTKFMQAFQSSIDYLESTDLTDIIQQLTIFINRIVQELNSINYKDFVDLTNITINIYTAYLNEVIDAYEIPQKLEAMRQFVEFVLTSFLEHMRETQIAEMVQAVLHVIVREISYNCEMFSAFIKQTMPTQLDIPEFTIMGNTVTATTVTFEEIPHLIPEVLDFILTCDINMSLVDAFLNHLKFNYHPFIPDITLPEITDLEISFPNIPHFPVEKLVQSLELPSNKLPALPSDVVFPCFGKLHGHLKFLTPVYTVEVAAGFQNSTENELIPHFTGFLHSQAVSPVFESLNFRLESNTSIAIPKMSRLVLAESIQFNHPALGLEHQASLAAYGQSAQAQAKTAVKVTTTHYTTDVFNTAFIAVAEGMTARLDTTYTHLADFPFNSNFTVTHKSVARQDGLSFTLTSDNSATSSDDNDVTDHKSNLELSFTPVVVTLTFSGDTNSTAVKMKQQINGKIYPLSYFKINDPEKTETQNIGSILDMSGQGELYYLIAKQDFVASEGQNFEFNFALQPDEFSVELKKNQDMKMQDDDNNDVFYNVTAFFKVSQLKALWIHHIVGVDFRPNPTIRLIVSIYIPNMDDNRYAEMLGSFSEEILAQMKSNQGRFETEFELPAPQ